MDNGIDSTVSSLENEFVCCQAGFDPLSLCSAPLSFGFKKLRADKRKPRGWRAVRDQTGGSRGVLIKQIGEGLMKTVSRRRWSYSQPGRQITVKNSHVNGVKFLA